MVAVVEGAWRATDQIPFRDEAEVVFPSKNISTLQSNSGTCPVSENTTPPATSNGLLGARRAPSPSKVPCDRMSFTLSSGTSIAAENRQRCSGNARNTSCPARSATRIPGSRRVSPKSGVVQASRIFTFKVMSLS